MTASRSAESGRRPRDMADPHVARVIVAGDTGVTVMESTSASLLLDPLWEELNAAAYDPDIARRRIGLDDAIRQLRDELRSGEDPEVLYVLGDALYMHPDRLSSATLRTQLLGALERVLTLVPGDPYALLYLGHHEYDMGERESAARRFAAIDPSSMPPHLRIKAHEMQVCCCLRLRGLSECSDQLSTFEQHCASHPEMLQVDPPLNLLRALEQVAADAGPASLEPVRESLLRLDAAAGVRWFSELLE